MPVTDVATAIEDLNDRAPGYSLYRDYEDGRHRYPYATAGFKRNFEWILRQARANLMPAVRESFTDLVQVQAWAGQDVDHAVQIAEQVDLNQVLDLTIAETWRTGDAYVLAWPDAAGVQRPWYHRADQVTFQASQDVPGMVDWYAKRWTTSDGHGRVNVYYADRVERYVTPAKIQHEKGAHVDWPDRPTAWVEYTDGDGPVIAHQQGRPPWVHLTFDADTQGGHGRSVLRDAVPGQDALNHALHALIVNTEQYAAPLRALMQHNPVKRIDEETGRQVEEKLEIDPTKQSIYGFTGAGPLVQLNPADAENVLSIMEAHGSWIARTVGIPVSDIAPELGNIPSGASLRVLAHRRTSKVRNFTRANTGTLADLMALLGAPGARPEWVDPAPSDEVERVAVAQAKRDLGYPLAEVLPDLGEDPDDVQRILDGQVREQASIGREARSAFLEGRDPASFGA